MGAVGGAGTGMLSLNKTITVVDRVDLQKDPANNDAQIIELGNGADPCYTK